ncbi:MAG: ribosome silencing factor [Bacilli bacterium]|nr:ribosome silencing factor [Bacilli bacterium]
MIDETTQKELDALIACLEEHKGEDIVTIDVSESSPFASAVVIATCPNPRALGAMQGHLEDTLEQNGIEVAVKEGEPDSGWVITQGQEVIVHLLLAGNRRVLDLETLLAQVNEKFAPKKK